MSLVSLAVEEKEQEITPVRYRSRITICSVYPEPLRKQWHIRPVGIFQMKAAPPDGYSLLTVGDSWQRILNTSATTDEEGLQYQDAPISAYEVASSLEAYWTSPVILSHGGFHIGVGIIAGSVPTPEELVQLRAVQTRYFEILVHDADTLWFSGKRNEVMELHRLALRWLGSEDREWYKRIEPVLLKKCPACEADINRNAVVCKECNRDLGQFYLDRGIEPSDDPAVLEDMKRLAKKRKT